MDATKFDTLTRRGAFALVAGAIASLVPTGNAEAACKRCECALSRDRWQKRYYVCYRKKYVDTFTHECKWHKMGCRYKDKPDPGYCDIKACHHPAEAPPVPYEILSREEKRKFY